MTITVEISPETAAELAGRAASQGRSLESYAASLLEEAASVLNKVPPLTEARIEDAIRTMAKYSPQIPALPDSALTRESIYQDHD